MTLRLLPLAFVLACTGSPDGTVDEVSSDSGTDTGEPVTAEGVEGRWRFMAVESWDGGGLTRGGNPGVAGDIVVSMTDAQTGQLSIRIAALIDETPDGDLDAPEFPFTVASDGMWLLDTGDTLVFAPHLDGDTLSLTAQGDDPRHTGGEDGPSSMTLARIPEPAGLSVGRWALASATFGSQTVPAGACDGGNAFTFELAIDERYLLTETLTESRYLDVDCTQLESTEVTVLDALVEEEEGALRLYIAGSQAGPPAMQLQFDMSVSGDDLVLDLAACWPASECEGGAPDRMVLSPIAGR
ncbi:MAG: hypothetical protein EP330_27495 [Deltaproteobacteria bacterium]|nr:MAG: hypothetical protein EP330_27495 [Deltaproteobacteria bacterium]